MQLRDIINITSYESVRYWNDYGENSCYFLNHVANRTFCNYSIKSILTASSCVWSTEIQNCHSSENATRIKINIVLNLSIQIHKLHWTLNQSEILPRTHFKRNSSFTIFTCIRKFYFSFNRHYKILDFTLR